MKGRATILAALGCLLAFTATARSVPPPPVAARAFAMVDVQSGQMLATGSEGDRLEPASLTKLMTAYVVFDALKTGRLQETQAVVVSTRARDAAGVRMAIDPAKGATLADLLRGMVVHAANDAAVALAEAVSGSEEAFTVLMNRHAERLGLADTRFTNATGLPAPGHESSARDLARLAMALLRDFPERQALFGGKEFGWNGIIHNNRNRLLWIDPSVDGLATGFTESSGYGIAASARRGDRRLVAVVLGAQTEALRTSETLKLLNFGFLAYETRRLYRSGEALGSREVFKGTSPTIALGLERDVWLTLPRSQFTGLKATLETQQPFVAPFARGQRAGLIKVSRDQVALAEYPVVALDEVPVAGFLSRGYDTLRLLLFR